MKRDLGSESDLFDCEWDSIDSVINAVVVFTGVKKDVQTENGIGILIAFGEGASRSAFIYYKKNKNRRYR